MNEILKTWEKLKTLTLRAFSGNVHKDLPAADEERIKTRIAECIYATGGEFSSRSRAVELGKTFLKLSAEGRLKFMTILALEFGVDNQRIDACIKHYQEVHDDDGQRAKAEMELQQALIPPRVKLLKRFNALPDGFKFLVEFRAQLMPVRKSRPYLGKLEADLKRLLSSWFDIGLLDLEEITWDSPAALLEKLIRYEAVHEIRSWADLKNRLDSHRLCFAFFHNKMPGEPLIFVEVALVGNMPDNIKTMLDSAIDPILDGVPDTAVFYSISNAQNGLAGINLGNFLIKRVVKELSARFKSLKHYATLSPVPSFRKWLNPLLADSDETLFTHQEIQAVNSFTGKTNAAVGVSELINNDWSADPLKVKLLKPILMRLCAFYLLEVKRNSKAFDPVANFHLTNGARLERINWMGDLSHKGLKQSCGIMVNYYYNLSIIEKNHENYVSDSIINVSRDVRKWLKK